MFALLEFIVRLVGDVGRFTDIFLNDLILGAGDPLSVISLFVGQVLIGLAVLAFGYAAVGALFNEIGVKLPSLGGGSRTE